MSNRTPQTDARLTRRSFLGSALLAGIGLALSGCSTSSSSTADETSGSAADASSASSDADGYVTLKAQADTTPHTDILNYAEPYLEERGIKVDIVSSDNNRANNLVESGEVDFNYFQHEPYLNEWDGQNGGDLVSAGGIHVEPITAYSDKYATAEEIPDDAIVAIPSDATNEYRALLILEKAGFIVLDDDATTELGASLRNVSEYVRPLTIIELDSEQIIPTKDDYDFFITNTSKVLTAGIDSARLFSEDADSPYANIIAVKADRADDESIKTLVEVLLSDDVQDWINEEYDGAVIGAAKA